MGLDNGLRLKKVKKEDILKFPKFVTYDQYSDIIEIAYWRKCWGIRQAIIDKFHLNNDDAFNVFDREDIPALIEVLYKFLSKEYWDENADSIWTFEEYVDNNIQIIINLKWLCSFLEDNPEIEIEFYDSY